VEIVQRTDATVTAPASDALEATARRARAMLVGFLASRAGGDLAAAEDALSEAFLAALQQWPLQGVPEKREAWLLTVARRRLMDEQRKLALREERRDAVRLAFDAAQDAAESDGEFPDERLKLLFVCAHPAIDPATRTPLMLQVVLGLDAAAIASAFLVAPSAMSQRLVRAKMKIKSAAIPFVVPDRGSWDERLGFVLDAVYAAFNQSWQAWPGDGSFHALGLEALGLGEMLVEVLPEDPEALGLLALMLYCHSRRHARRDAAGEYVPLDLQNPDDWDHPLKDPARHRDFVRGDRARLAVADPVELRGAL